MDGYPSASSSHTSSRPVTPSSDQNIPYSNPGSRAVSPPFFDQYVYSNQATDFGASDMESIMSNVSSTDPLMEAQILEAMSNGTLFSNSNLGLEGFDVAFPFLSVTDAGSPSRQLASQMSSPSIRRSNRQSLLLQVVGRETNLFLAFWSCHSISSTAHSGILKYINNRGRKSLIEIRQSEN